MLRTILVALVAAAVAAPTASAGGWAVVRLDQVPAGARAGERLTVGFTVLQHGVRPVGMDVLGEPPRLVATDLEGRSPVTALARPQGAHGHYVVDVTIPRAGAWRWKITPGWFAATTFEPLTVAPPPSPAPVRDAATTPVALGRGGPGVGVLTAGAAGLLGLAVLAALAARRGGGRRAATNPDDGAAAAMR